MRIEEHLGPKAVYGGKALFGQTPYPVLCLLKKSP